MTRPEVRSPTSRWWKVLLAGLLLLGVFVVVTSIGELPNESAWYVAMAVLLMALALIVTGVTLGIAARRGH